MNRLLSAALVATLTTAFGAGTLLAQQFALNKPVSDFTFQDLRGHRAVYKAHSGRVTVVMFFSTRCPLSNAFNYRRNMIYKDYKNRVRFIVIDSNANESFEEVKAYSKNAAFSFPVYKDANNAVADQFNVWATTDNFVIDSMGIMRYHGYIEDSPNPERSKVQGLRLAITAVLNGKPVEVPERKTRGCAIRRSQLHTTSASQP